MSLHVRRIRVSVAIALVSIVVAVWGGHAMATGEHDQVPGAACGIALCLGVAAGIVVGGRLRLVGRPAETLQGMVVPVISAPALAPAVTPRAASPPPLRL